MHDEFDKKREVVKSLMQMLGKNAHDEVSGSMMPKKEVSVEKVSMKPDAEMPHDDMAAMSDGGLAEASDEPMREMVDSLPEVSDGGNEDIVTEPETPIEEQDEDNNSSAFGAFMKRRKK